MNSSIEQIRSTKSDGFSLIELVFALFIFSIVSIFAFVFYEKFNQAYFYERDLTRLFQEAFISLDRMSKDIQLLGAEPKRHLFYPRAGIRGLNESLFADPNWNYVADQIRLVRDVNGDGDIQKENEMITYLVNEKGELKRNEQVLMKDVLKLSFQYYDEKGKKLDFKQLKSNLPKSKESLITLVKIILQTKNEINNPKTSDLEYPAFMTMIRIMNR